MPTPTYTPLATVTLGTAAASVTFSSIPATYRDLILVIQATTSSDALPWLRFNSDTGTNYGYVQMTGSPTVSSSANTFDRSYLLDGSVKANNPFFAQGSVMDFSATDKHKTMLVRSGMLLSATDQSAVYASAHRWANTAAITTVLVSLTAGNYNSGSTFNLYGVIA
jgi:hypothetical protein